MREGSTVKKVSVCIPVYNGEKFLAQAIESVLAQTFTDYELIVLDNASTDRTPEIIRQYNDPRITVIRHPTNIGAVNNFNAGIKAAKGTWVKIVCADDMLFPDCLEKQAGAVSGESSRNVVIVSCARNIIDENGRTWLKRNYPGRAGLNSGREAVRKTICSGSNGIGEPSAVLLRRDALVKAGGFDAKFRFCVDVDLWAKMLRGGDLFAIPDVLCSFRVSRGSWSMSLVYSQAREYIDWMKYCRKNKIADLSAFDLLAGKINANMMMAKRFIFYRFVLRRNRRPN
jgi:glycosyltransferase involved in cell wall biosynthesis